MTQITELETQRLKLRQWRESDYPVFAQMNSDDEVMKYYPAIMSEAESNNMVKKFSSLIANRGWGFWAVEEKSTGQFIGFVGLHEPTYDLPVTPCVEVGWRLGRKYWGKGYATEAANEALKFAFKSLGLNEVYSFTSVQNKKSSAVMQRLHMRNMDNNFMHPIIPAGHKLSEHVLYRITKEQWENIKKQT